MKKKLTKKQRQYLIYCLRNKFNNKLYIGYTYNLTRRMGCYRGLRCKSQTKIYNALNKYGFQNFQITILCENLQNMQDAKFWQKNYIKALDTFNTGYNCTEGGQGFCGKHSEQSKRKMSISRTGRKHTQQSKKKISDFKLRLDNPVRGIPLSDQHKAKIAQKNKGENNYFYGKHHTQEVKKKISQKNSGQNGYFYGKELSEQHRRKISESRIGQKNPMYGKKHSEQTLKKISQAGKGRKMTQKNKQALLKVHKGKIVSEQTRNKLRIANTGYKHTPQQIQKMKGRSGQKNHYFGKKHSPEILAKMRIAQQKRWDKFHQQKKKSSQAIK